MQAQQYIDHLAAGGRRHFTTADAIEAFGGNDNAVRARLRRLNRKGLIASPIRSFHVVIPPVYRRYGCSPGTRFIDPLMEVLDTPYYVALLSAGERHGAAHQRPQVLQVMVPKNRPRINCNGERIWFTARGDLERMPVTLIETDYGKIRYSTPEVTALDLVGYMIHAGGPSNVATVLTELAEEMDPQKLLEVARLCHVGWSQRLGYLLEFLQEEKLAAAIEPFVRDSAKSYTPLCRILKTRGAKRNQRWKVIVNYEVDPDI